ncbi:MAG: hypothetical protein JWO42_3908 [Chloroflexi bacterium]|nr:hypothetical protein [Chloroflexota bacterium]
MNTNPSVRSVSTAEAWPALPLETWRETYATLHMWVQIVGKVRTALSPQVNHWWTATLYVTTRGLTTSPIPYGTRTFEIYFDFIDHNLLIQTNDGMSKSLRLYPRSVADFYRELMDALRSLQLDVAINPLPQEVPNPIPFDEDDVHSTYDGDYAHRFWKVLVQADRVFKDFRARFIGKCSPVHLFWGSLDLAVTRFSGRLAPERDGADQVTREAYSHEVISCGFWPGSGPVQEAAFYAYAAPVPHGLGNIAVRPVAAWFDHSLGEFLLRYDTVRTAPDPDAVLLDFLQSTYEVAADLAQWDRAVLER